MPTIQPQAVAGVSASIESEVMTVYPSIGSTFPGQLLGRLYDCLAIPVLSTNLSRLLFPLPTAPLGATIYMLLKIAGSRYRLTNRSVQIWSSLGERRHGSADLNAIADVKLVQQPGQKFFKCADIVLLDASGKKLLTLGGVPRAEVFRQTILKARDARVQVQSAMSVIAAR